VGHVDKFIRKAKYTKMIEPIDTTTSSLTLDTIQELSLQASNTPATSPQDKVNLSAIAQAAVAADQIRLEQERAATTLAAERANEVRNEQERVAATQATQRAEETRVEQIRTEGVLTARANEVRVEQQQTVAADEALSRSNSLVTA
jgi:hypothetical protein